MNFQRLFKCYHSLSNNKFYIRHTFSSKAPIQVRPIITCNNLLVPCKTHTVPNFNVSNLWCQRMFHSKPPKKALPTFVWILLLPFLQVGAILMGRRLRIWWMNLPENKMAYILDQIKLNQEKIILGFVFCNGLIYAFYITHIVEDPITKRKKFLLFSDNQVREMAKNEWMFLVQKYKRQIATTGYHYNNVLQISQRILSANKHLPGVNRDWRVIIVNDEIKNAFVLPSGHIFVFTGILKFVDNNDQLAAIIGHEISHVLLSHAAENISKTFVLNFIMLLPFLALCALLPGMEHFARLITDYLSNILFHLPFSRLLELEADILGLEMMSKACYDPQQARLFWTKMEKIEKGKQIEWLSTHPSHETRSKKMNEHMSKALSIFKYNCKNEDMNPHLSN